MEKAGIDRSEVFVTNALRCQPDESPPSRDSLDSCRERMCEEVLAYPRKVILTLGNSAARAFLGDHAFKITSKRGQPIDLGDIGIVMPSFHPASILRNQGEYPRWLEDIMYAGRLLHGGSKALKDPGKPTAYVCLLEPDEAAFYPKVRRANPNNPSGRVVEVGEDTWRTWDESIKDGTQLKSWPKRVVTTGIPAAKRAIDMLLELPVLSADIETGYSYSPRMGKVLCLAVAWSATESVVFSEGLMNSKAFRPHLKRLLTSPGPLWVGQNFKYDTGFLDHRVLEGGGRSVGPNGVLGNFHDTMLEHYCLDETKGTHGLEDLARDLLGAEDYKFVVRKYGIKDAGYENVPREILYPYCALDTTHAFAIHELLCPKIHASASLTKLYEQLLLPASRFLQSVQDYGLYCNQPFVDKLDIELGERLRTAKLRLIKEVEPLWDTDEFMESQWATKKRPEDYNASNWRHTSFILYKLIGWVPMNTNERTLRDLDQTGQDQSATFGYKAKNYARGHPNRKQQLNYPFIQALIDVRLAKHAYGMMIKGIRKYTEPDGRLHTTFNLQTTETGRLSSTGPNLQNLPVPEKGDTMPSRDIVGAPEGRVILEADYSQVELRLLAHFSHDDALIEVYREGRDLHTELSIAIWGPGYTNYQRVRAKAVNFGIAYGRGAGSIAAEHDMPEEEAEEMRQAWFRRFPQAAAWLNELHQAPFKGRTVISPFGRRRRFGVVSRENYHELKNQSANFPMQSTATDLTLYSAMRIQDRWDALGCDAHVVCLVHDAIVVECPEEDAALRSDELRAMMEDTPRRVLQPLIDFPVDVHMGRAWGTLKLHEMGEGQKGSAGALTDTFGKAGTASGKL